MSVVNLEYLDLNNTSQIFSEISLVISSQSFKKEIKSSPLQYFPIEFCKTTTMVITTPVDTTSATTGNSGFHHQDDSSSPYFLTSGDNPGNILVSQSLIGAENFNTWYRSMMVALRAKNKLGFVDGSIQEPGYNDVSHEKWIRCDNMILSWIINSISKEIVSSIIYGNNSREVWVDIKERYSQKNGPRIFQLKKAISSLKQEQMSVTMYFVKMKGLWDELSSYVPIPVCNCGVLKNCVCNIVKSLFETQEHEQERQRQITVFDSKSENSMESMAMFTRHGDNTNTSYGESKNMVHTGPYNKVIKKDRPLCTHCGMLGHIADKCFKLHGYPPGYKFKAKGHTTNGTMAHQVQAFESQGNSTSVDPSMNQITPAMCQQLLTYLHSHMDSQNQSHLDSQTSALSGPHPMDNDWTG